MKTKSLALVLIFALVGQGRAEVVVLDIYQRVPFADGKAFGEVGPYEMIRGVVRYAIDPKNDRNQAIVDLELAPRNKQGKVEFAADVCILAPKDPSKGNGAIFYDVNNRGNKLALRMFNFAPGGNDLSKPGSEGDGFLMRRGYTIVWSGWIGELLAGEHRLLLEPPLALQGGKPLRGLARFEMSTDKPAKSLPLSRREGHGSYAPTKEGLDTAVLTVRQLENDKRKPIPRDQWKLTTLKRTPVEKGVNGSLNQIRLEVEGGFRPGDLYELVCECEGSLVMGTGFAAVRDLISFLRHDVSDKNPLRVNGKPACTRAHAFGVSQSGRFLRHLRWECFHRDEQVRSVFDGMMPHVAGGGLGFFNHRFAQPTRHNGQHEDHTYPADFFPFAYSDETDPFTKRWTGIVPHYSTSRLPTPKIMHTQSAAEYWHRSGSLVHTDPLGRKDSDIPDNVRIYAFGGTQHGPASDPPARGIGQNLANPGDYRPFLRALLDGLDAWVKDGKEPPASVYPRIADKTLVSWKQDTTGFPEIPGVRYPRVIQQPAFCDYGPDFLTKGIIAKEPPAVRGHYAVLVPKSDKEGNDLGCLSPPEVAVPLATFTGWNLRNKEAGAENMLASLMGSYIPFPTTKAERQKAKDPRTSLEERYGPFDVYEENFAASCRNYIKGGYLLAEDAGRLIRERAEVRKLFEGLK